MGRNVCTQHTQRAVDNFITKSHLEVLCPAPGTSTSRWIPHGVDSRNLTTFRVCEGTTLTEAANGMLEKVLSAPNGYTQHRAHLLLLHGVVRGNVKKMVMNCKEYDNVGHSQVSKATTLCVHMQFLHVGLVQTTKKYLLMLIVLLVICVYSPIWGFESLLYILLLSLFGRVPKCICPSSIL